MAFYFGRLKFHHQHFKPNYYSLQQRFQSICLTVGMQKNVRRCYYLTIVDDSVVLVWTWTPRDATADFEHAHHLLSGLLLCLIRCQITQSVLDPNLLCFFSSSAFVRRRRATNNWILYPDTRSDIAAALPSQ